MLYNNEGTVNFDRRRFCGMHTENLRDVGGKNISDVCALAACNHKAVYVLCGLGFCTLAHLRAYDDEQVRRYKKISEGGRHVLTLREMEP